MKLLEHEAKTILQKYDIPVPHSVVVKKDTVVDFSFPAIIKSQVPAGGRGKAGGIRVVKSQNEAKKVTEELFAHPIKGYVPATLLVEEFVATTEEYYLSLLIDYGSGSLQLLAHRSGGVEVEDNNADTFIQLQIDEENTNAVGEQLAEYYNLPEQTFALQDLLKNLVSCFVKNDATLLEINPLILTKENKLVTGDCKMELDDAAFFRHNDWQFETKAQNTNFVKLDERGTVATIANGAGLAMSTVDAVAANGMTPANFLDIGGGATTAGILEAFEKIVALPNIQAIIINIFAGITRCDEVARAIIEARQQITELPPLFIRLAGTNYDEAALLLQKENITVLGSLEKCLSSAREIAR